MLEMTKHVRDGSMNAASMRFRVFCRFIVEGYYSLILFQRVWRLAPHDSRKRLEQTINALCSDQNTKSMASPVMVAAAARDAAITSLSELLGDRLSTGELVREHHGRDASYHPCMPPDAVAFAQSTEEVSAIVRICARHKVPIIPFGSGSGLEGNVVALRGGVSIDLTRMNRILRVSPGDLDATVQAGVTHKQLNEQLRDKGIFFSGDPGADATLGGMAATRAAAPSAVRYGTMRENVLSLTVVLPDGRVIRTSRRARKSSAGYDLTRLFVGSEGTLGVITEVTVRLYGIPAAMSSATCSFPSVEAAVDTVIRTIQLGVPVARIELADAATMEAVNRYSKIDLPVAPTLWVDFHGTQASVAEQRGWSRGLQANMAAPILLGQQTRKSAGSCGRRATTLSMRSRPRARAARLG